MSTTPITPDPEQASLGPNSLDAENVLITGGVIDTTVRPTPEHVRKYIEKHRPWLLKPQDEQGTPDRRADGDDGSNEPPESNGVKP